MAPVSGSQSRGKRPKTSSSPIADLTPSNQASIAAAADSPSLGLQTPPPPPSVLTRRSPRLSAASASASTNPNPSLGAALSLGGTAVPDGVLGKRKGRLDWGSLSVGKEIEKEIGSVGVDDGDEMGAGEERRMSLRSGSKVGITIRETTSNVDVTDYNSNNSVERRRSGRLMKSNPAGLDQIQQEGEKEMRDADGGGDGKELEAVMEARFPSLRSGDKGKGKLIIDEELVNPNYGGVTSRFTDKGKGKLVEEDSAIKNHAQLGFDLNYNSDSDSDSDSDSSIMAGLQGMPPVGPVHGSVLQGRREIQRNRAIELAPKFAFFKDEEAADSEGDADDESPDAGVHDWPGPFSTAMKLIEERESILKARQEGRSSKGSESAAVPISWMPSGDKGHRHGSVDRKPPPLRSLCIKVLADNAHEIESLAALPDMIKSKLIPILCHSRKMTTHHLSELVTGSLVELQLSDCSWATEREFEDIFTSCDASQLKELQLDLCGRCLPDYILRSSLAKAPNSLPSLTKLSLKGAYSLSDDGLAAIVLSAPLLSSLNLCNCSLLTSEGIASLADNLGSSLREIYIDNCQNVIAMDILPSLKKAKCLEVLSMAGIQSVSDKFIRELIPVCGSTIKELNFSGCSKLTSGAIKVIGENCPQLSTLDIRNLTRLKDVALGHLANGCRDINRLLLRGSSFSDEAIAAFVEASGTKLIELSLNNIEKVGHQTAIAISRRCCMCLQKLDLSFCRKMSDQALGLIVDGCSSLKTLKLFGCTQVTDLFLKGHSNNLVEIVGLDGNVLGKVRYQDFL